jgi:hypothetical protein
VLLENISLQEEISLSILKSKNGNGLLEGMEIVLELVTKMVLVVLEVE